MNETINTYLSYCIAKLDTYYKTLQNNCMICCVSVESDSLKQEDEIYSFNKKVYWEMGGEALLINNDLP